MNPLFTIGHSNHTIDGFIKHLKGADIEAIVDVRSSPYSKYAPWFNKEALKVILNDEHIRYVYLGKELGARRDEPCCYKGKRADYDLIAKTPNFTAGMQRLQQGLAKYRIALMCSEKDPLDCHRTVLVSRHALSFAEVQHIHADGSIETHCECEQRMLAKLRLNELDLFSDPGSRLNLAYQRLGHKIAYTKSDTPQNHD
jgi:uncharacterized protein (DUF488 family)